MNPEQNKNTLYYVMYYGAWLGFFWIFKYLFLMGKEDSLSFLAYFYYLLNIFTPILMYVFYMHYLKLNPNAKHTIGRCILFIVGMAFFASIFEDAMIFARFSYFDSEGFYKIIAPMEQYINNYPYEQRYNPDQIAIVKKAYAWIMRPKILLVFYLVTNTLVQLITSFFFALIIGIMTTRKFLRR